MNDRKDGKSWDETRPNKYLISDEVIYLRKLEECDLPRTWAWINSAEIAVIMGTRCPISKAEQRIWFDNLSRSDSKMVFALCLHEGSQHVGNVSLDMIDYTNRTARLAIFITDKALRGQGVGRRAIMLLAQYVFEFLNLNKLHCKSAADKPKICTFYKALGFRLEGRLREHEYSQGQYVDKLQWGLLRSDFCGEARLQATEFSADEKDWLNSE